jgi:gamma-tubulin complex component 5
MSGRPTSKTHDLAHEYLHRQPVAKIDRDKLLYDEIMAEPFEGDHWGQGYDSEIKEGWTDSETESEKGVSSDSGATDEVIITPHRARPLHSAVDDVDAADDGEEGVRRAEEELRRLREDAYWRTSGGGQPVIPVKLGEGWRAVSTGLSVATLAASLPGLLPQDTKVSRLYEGG